MYIIFHEQKGSSDRLISRGTRRDRYMGTGEAFPLAIGPEGADYFDGDKWGVESGYSCEARDDKAHGATMERAISGTSVDRSGKRCSAARTRQSRIYIEKHNQNPQVFVWSAPPEQILAKMAICKEALAALN